MVTAACGTLPFLNKLKKDFKMKLNKKQTALLNALAAVEFEYHAPVDVMKLQTAGLVEVNQEMESEGKYATRITEEGRKALETPAETETAPSFEITIDSDVPMPETTRVSRGSIYPFEKLEIGQSFFVPKDIRSATSSHGKREADKGGLRRWSCRNAIENGVEGSRVWRIADREQPVNNEAAE